MPKLASWIGCCVAGLLFGYAGPGFSASTENTDSPAGTNLYPPTYYSSDMVILDLFSKSSEWVPSSATYNDSLNSWTYSSWNACDGQDVEPTDIHYGLCDDGVAFELDNSSWPTAAAGNTPDVTVPGGFRRVVAPTTRLFKSTGGKWPHGKYVFLWDVNNVRDDTTLIVRYYRAGEPYAQTYRFAASAGRAVISVDRADDWGMDISLAGIPAGLNQGQTVPAISNIRMLPPGGVTGTVDSSGSITDLDPMGFCENLPDRDNGTQTLDSSVTCIDFEHAHFNRFSDSLFKADSPRELNSNRIAFHPKALLNLRKFATLRYMEWQRMNDTPQEFWSDRALLTDHSWSNYDGVPFEMMIALSNTLQADAWFTIPYLADDNYIQALATLVNDHLDISLRSFVEYTNETWNGAFVQSSWVKNETVQEDSRLPRQRDPGGPGGSDGWQIGNEYTAQRTMEIGELWRGVYGAVGSADEHRVVLVLAGQAANDYILSQRMQYVLANLSSPGQRIDALAIAPYFGNYIGSSDNIPVLTSWTVESIMEEILTGKDESSTTPGVPLDNRRAGGALEESLAQMQSHKALADSHGLPMIAYEAGQHVLGVNFNGYSGPETQQEKDAIMERFRLANESVQMGTAYDRYFSDWDASGGTNLVNYVHVARPSTYGSFGVLDADFHEDYSVPTSTKFASLMNWITAHQSGGPVDPDTDGDGYPDSIDAYPNDPEEWADSNQNGIPDNAEAQINLAIGVMDSGEYGRRFGSNENPDTVERKFWLPGSSALTLEVVGYDVSNNTEIEVLFNNTSIGFLSRGPRRALNSGDSFSIPESLVQSGLNTIVFDATGAGRWGVTDILVDIAGTTPQPPTPPGSLSATANASAIELMWTASTDPDVSSYRIYRRSDSSNFALLNSGQTALHYTDTAAVPGVEYEYAITAYAQSSGLESVFSDTASARIESSGSVTHDITPFAVTVQRQGRRYRGSATINVSSSTGSGLAGASIVGYWELIEAGGSTVSVDGDFSGVTDSAGEITIRSSRINASSGDKFRLTVTDVTHPTSSYAPGTTPVTGLGEVQ